MSDSDAMQRKLADIGARYIARTAGEVATLENLVTQLADGEIVLKQIEMIAHRLHGSGAVFGFQKISELAGEIEATARRVVSRDEMDLLSLQQRLIASIAALALATAAALHNE